MFKRLFWLMFGFLLGSASSWAVTRRVRRIVAAARARRRGRPVERQRGSAVSEGRDAMRTREASSNRGFDRATGQ